MKRVKSFNVLAAIVATLKYITMAATGSHALHGMPAFKVCWPSFYMVNLHSMSGSTQSVLLPSRTCLKRVSIGPRTAAMLADHVLHTMPNYGIIRPWMWHAGQHHARQHHLRLDESHNRSCIHCFHCNACATYMVYSVLLIFRYVGNGCSGKVAASVSNLKQ